MGVSKCFKITLITTPILLGIMVWHGAALKTPTTPAGIIDAEFAATIPRAEEILLSWQQPLIQHAIYNTYIDFFFLLSYGIFLFAAVFLLAKKLKGGWRTIGKLVAYAMLLTALLDAIENFGILMLLNGQLNASVIYFTWLFASIKFILVFLGFVYLLVAGIYFLWFRTRLRSASIKEAI